MSKEGQKRISTRGSEWSFKKCVSRKILARFQGSRCLEFSFDAFLESRFFLQGLKGLGFAEKILVSPSRKVSH